MATAKELTQYGRAGLEIAGFKVYHMTFYKRVPKTMKGFPDVIALHPQRKLIAFGEIKGDKDTIKDDQKEFANIVAEMNIPNILHRFISSHEDWDEIINYFPKELE